MFSHSVCLICRRFQELLNKYNEINNPDGLDTPSDVLRQGYEPITVFVPTDDSINALNQLSFNRAIRNNSLLKQVCCEQDCCGKGWWNWSARVEISDT